jgi:hypothetical protein
MTAGTSLRGNFFESRATRCSCNRRVGSQKNTMFSSKGDITTFKGITVFYYITLCFKLQYSRFNFVTYRCQKLAW